MPTAKSRQALISAPGYDILCGLMIREAVIAARDSRDWKDLKLSQESGVPYSRLYEWLYRGKTISSGHIENLMRTLGLRMCRGKVEPIKKKRGPK